MHSKESNRGGLIMKKIIRTIGAMLMVVCLNGTVLFASEQATVVFQADDTIAYEGSTGRNQEGVLLGKAFQGMAPGETRTECIKLENRNEKTADFYMSQETLRSLEKTKQAYGGAYDFTLKTGTQEETATSVMDALAGGYSTVEGGNQASRDGLAEVDGMEDYTYIATLEKGASTNLYLTLSLNGEGLDSTSQVDYTESVADIGMNFKVAEVSGAPEKNVVTKTVTTIRNVVVPLADTVRTGDDANIILYIVILGAGMVVTLLVAKRKKGGTNES